MAIEKGVDDIDMDELDIEDSSKEIVIGVEGQDDQFIEEEDVQTLQIPVHDPLPVHKPQPVQELQEQIPHLVVGEGAVLLLALLQLPVQITFGRVLDNEGQRTPLRKIAQALDDVLVVASVRLQSLQPPVNPLGLPFQTQPPKWLIVGCMLCHVLSVLGKDAASRLSRLGQVTPYSRGCANPCVMFMGKL